MSKKRILIVDDDVKYAGLIKTRLEQTGDYDVRLEPRASQAVAVAKVFEPHAVLVDVVMPEMDGGQLVSQLKAVDRFKQLPVVFLTSAVTDDEVTQEGGTIGGHTFMAKPVNIPALVECLRKCLGSA